MRKYFAQLLIFRKFHVITALFLRKDLLKVNQKQISKHE